MTPVIDQATAVTKPIESSDHREMKQASSNRAVGKLQYVTWLQSVTQIQLRNHNMR